jgi:MFS family permease
MAGLVVVAVASLAAGFASDQTQLIIARAAQGLGTAIVSPSALSIVTTRTNDALAGGSSLRSLTGSRARSSAAR